MKADPDWPLQAAGERWDLVLRAMGKFCMVLSQRIAGSALCIQKIALADWRGKRRQGGYEYIVCNSVQYWLAALVWEPKQMEMTQGLVIDQCVRREFLTALPREGESIQDHCNHSKAGLKLSRLTFTRTKLMCLPITFSLIVYTVCDFLSLKGSQNCFFSRRGKKTKILCKYQGQGQNRKVQMLICLASSVYFFISVIPKLYDIS